MLVTKNLEKSRTIQKHVQKARNEKNKLLVNRECMDKNQTTMNEVKVKRQKCQDRLKKLSAWRLGVMSKANNPTASCRRGVAFKTEGNDGRFDTDSQMYYFVNIKDD